MPCLQFCALSKIETRYVTINRGLWSFPSDNDPTQTHGLVYILASTV